MVFGTNSPAGSVNVSLSLHVIAAAAPPSDAAQRFSQSCAVQGLDCKAFAAGGPTLSCDATSCVLSVRRYMHVVFR